MQRTRPAPFLRLLACLGLLLASAAHSASLEQQRAAFLEVYPAAERGNWTPASQQIDTLRDYVLWPDLRAVYLRTRLKSDDREIRDFLRHYGTLKPARELRYRYSLQLARAERYADFLSIYDSYYVSLGEASLDCLAAAGAGAAGPRRRGIAAGPHTLADRSQPGETVRSGVRSFPQCGPPVRRASTSSATTSRSTSRNSCWHATSHARSMTPHSQQANRWLRAQGDPQQFLRRADIGNR